MQVTSTKLKIGLSALLLTASILSVQALTVSPARMEIKADPGTPVTGKFLIINEQNTDQVFYTSVENFEAQGESGTPYFSQSKDGLASWVTVIDKVEIKKGDRLEIPFTINVPKNADAGGHFAAIFLNTVRPSTNGGEVSIGAKVGMLMLLRVSGTIKEEGGILSFSLKNSTTNVYTSIPLTFVYRFSNNGNDRANPSGTLSIKNMVGGVAKELNPNPALGNVLPNSIRRFEVTWNSNGNLSPTASFFETAEYQYRNFAFGKYTANLDLAFGEKGKTTSTISFYIIPWHLISLVVLVLFAVYIITHIAIKRHDKAIIERLRRMQRKSRSDE